MKEDEKREDSNNPPDNIPRRVFLNKSGKVLLFTASYVAISVLGGRTVASASNTIVADCTGATTVYPDPPCTCTSCTGCTSGCTSSCTKWCTGGCCISCTQSTQ